MLVKEEELLIKRCFTIWDASVTHEDHDLVNRLRVLGEIIPEHGAIIGMRQVG